MVKMSFFSKLIHKCKTIPIKIPIRFFTELNKPILKFHYSQQGLRIARASLKIIKLYKVIIIKTVRLKDKQNQGTKLKAQKQIHTNRWHSWHYELEGRIDFIFNLVLGQLVPHMGKIQQIPTLTPYVMINSRWRCPHTIDFKKEIPSISLTRTFYQTFKELTLILIELFPKT